MGDGERPCSTRRACSSPPLRGSHEGVSYLPLRLPFALAVSFVLRVFFGSVHPQPQRAIPLTSFP
jgi:hypothetical protein